MARSVVSQLHPRTPRYSPAIETESHMEAVEAARRLLVFTEDELRASFVSGDLNRLRTLQRAHHDATTILVEHRRQAAWHDARCSDGVKAPGHGLAS